MTANAVRVQTQHVIKQGGVIVFNGTCGECLAELACSYEVVGKQPTLENVLKDGFSIVRVK